MIIGMQVLSLAVLILLGIFVFKKYPLKLQTKPMIQVTFLIVIALILSYLSLMLAISGFPSLKIGFALVPLVLIGLVYGPSYGFIAGLIYDVLGLIITPTDLPFLGFTLTNVLVCTVPGLISRYSLFNQNMIKRIKISAGLLIGLLLTFIWTLTYQSWFSEAVMSLTNVQRIIISLILLIYLVIFEILLAKYQNPDNNKALSLVFVSVIVVEAVINLFLNPLWLYTMYGIPYLVSFFLRMLKLLVMIPVDTIIILTGYKLLQKLRGKQHE